MQLNISLTKELDFEKNTKKQKQKDRLKKIKNKKVKKENQNNRAHTTEKHTPSCLFPGALQQEWTHQVLDIPICNERKAVSKWWSKHLEANQSTHYRHYTWLYF